MLFMGEEYGEKAPFQYFISHGDQGLIDAVRKGRQAEFSHFGWKGQIPDPQSEETFERSRLDHSLAEQEPHRTLWLFYKTLLEYRRTRNLSNIRPTTVEELPSAIFVVRNTAQRALQRFFTLAIARRHYRSAFRPERGRNNSIPPIRNGEAHQPRQTNSKAAMRYS